MQSYIEWYRGSWGRGLQEPGRVPFRRPGELFVGRERELARLTDAFAEAQDGRGSIVVLTGEAGIGKTRTAEELADRVENQGAVVLRGRCYEGEQIPPYGPWRSALRSLSLSKIPLETAVLAATLPGSASLALPETDARIRFFDAVIEVLRTAACECTLLLFFDNLQWADTGSLKLLEHLNAELSDAAILVLGAYRDSDLDICHPLHATLAEIAKETRFRRISLSGLSPQEVREYLSGNLECEPSAMLVEEIRRRTEGNPLFLLELVRAMTEERGPDNAVMRIPSGLKEAIGARLARLPDPVTTVLCTASLIGRVFRLDVLALVTEGVTEDRIAWAMERAQAAGLVSNMPDEGGLYRFTHVLVQEVLHERVSSWRRSRLHLQIARALEQVAGPSLDESAAAIAYHLAEARDPESLVLLVPYTIKAADRALAQLAPDQALALLDRALGLREKMPRRSDLETAEPLYRRARALDEMTFSEEAAQSLVRAFDLYAGLGNVDRMVDAALTPVQQTIHMGPAVTWSYADSGLPALRKRAIEAVRPNSLEQGRLLAHGSFPSEIERALSIARCEKNEALELTALWHLAYSHMCSGQFAEARSEERQALAIASRLGDRWGARFLLYWRCRRSTLEGDLPALQAAAAQMLADAECERSRLSLAAAHQAYAIAAHLTGDWEACREHAHRCLALQLGPGHTHSHAVTLATLALTEYETGHEDLAEHYLETLGEVTGNREAPFPFYLPKMAWITGNTTRIEATARALEQISTPEQPFEWVTMSRNSASALIAVLRQDREEAERYLRVYGKWKGLRIPGNAGGMASDAIRALLLETLGEPEAAMAAFEEALAFCRRSGYGPELARTCRDYGRALLRRGAPKDAQRAVRALQQGLSLAQNLGMATLVAQIERAIGEAQRQRPLEEAQAFPARLSRREVEILRLIARGLTNAEIGDRLFISPNTVARHVQNLLEKTGMANRTEATAFAFRNGLVED